MAASEMRDGTEWDRAKEKVRYRDQHRCQSCRMTESEFRGVDLHVHHIRAVEDGGTNDLDNLVLLCSRCHRKAHNVGPVEGEYPISAIPEWPTYRVSSRDRYELKNRDRRLLRVLKENGPTQKKNIKQEGNLEEWEFKKSVDYLQLADIVGRLERGVYAYIPRSEYDRAMVEYENGNPPREIRFGAYDPHERYDQGGNLL